MSALEDRLAFQLKACRLPTPEREYVFAKPRKFRFDFVWVKQKVAVEVNGAVWSHGRHTRGGGATSDAEKLSLAAVAGYRVLVVTAAHIDSGQAVTWIEQALGGAKP
jgi:very-short-patch-repair endonuclease